MSTLGERLKKLRSSIAGRPTQEDVANAIGVPRPTFANWEIDRGEPDLKMVHKLADFFNVTIDYLLGRTNEQHPLTFEDIPPEALQYFRRAKNLPEGAKKQFLEAWKAHTKLIEEFEKNQK